MEKWNFVLYQKNLHTILQYMQKKRTSITGSALERLTLPKAFYDSLSLYFTMNRTIFTFLVSVSLLLIGCDTGGEAISARGKLVIIGGGDKSDKILKEMLVSAGLETTGYIAVLPMASEQPDSAFIDFAAEMKSVTPLPCINFNFSNASIERQSKLDSLKKAPLIYICGGDQSRFMSGVLEKDVHNALREAFRNGATIAGTSAGAAVMSQVMITGDQQRDSVYHSTYEIIESSNARYATGLGFLENTIIDQHFIVRSRYNRMLTALADHPGKMVVGIDESTAIVVYGDSARVVGESQVVVAEPVSKAMSENLKYAISDVRLKVVIPGKSFRILQ